VRGGCDWSAEDAYSSMATDPTFTLPYIWFCICFLDYDYIWLLTLLVFIQDGVLIFDIWSFYSKGWAVMHVPVQKYSLVIIPVDLGIVWQDLCCYHSPVDLSIDWQYFCVVVNVIKRNHSSLSTIYHYIVLRANISHFQRGLINENKLSQIVCIFFFSETWNILFKYTVHVMNKYMYWYVSPI
jgi:hypothetical protein